LAQQGLIQHLFDALAGQFSPGAALFGVAGALL
jgi:hypothetical protein